jgi:hypothetical protein
MPFGLKLLISAALLLPLGLVMGMPFPTGLRAVGNPTLEPGDSEVVSMDSSNRVEWAWALNAASSVLGSVIAMLVAIQWGLRATMLAAAGCYLAAAVLSRSFRPAHLMRSAGK